MYFTYYEVCHVDSVYLVICKYIQHMKINIPLIRIIYLYTPTIEINILKY